MQEGFWSGDKYKKNHVKNSWTTGNLSAPYAKKDMPSPTLLGKSGGNQEVMDQPYARLYRANCHKS